MRIDHQINLLRLAQVGMPLAVVFGIGGIAMGLCATAIVAGFLLWEYQMRPEPPADPTPIEEKKIAPDDRLRVMEVLNPKGPTHF
jgi:hypothetical protein